MTTLAEAIHALDTLASAIAAEQAALMRFDDIGPLDVAGAEAFASRRAAFAESVKDLEQRALDAVAGALGLPPSQATLASAERSMRDALGTQLAALQRATAQLSSAEGRANAILQGRARVLTAYARALRPSLVQREHAVAA